VTVSVEVETYVSSGITGTGFGWMTTRNLSVVVDPDA
jgi:hypothetical protein